MIKEWEEKLLELIDNDKLDNSDIKEIVFEFGIQTEYGEPRRWSRWERTVSKIGNRFFLTEWDCGLTEYQENGFYENPKEVFPKSITTLVPEHYETKKWWETKEKVKVMGVDMSD